MKVFLIIKGKSLSGGGGAERRFLRVLNVIKNKADIDVRLICNTSLYESAVNLNLLSSLDNVNLFKDKNCWDFIRFPLFVIRTLIDEKPNVVHLVLIQKSLSLLYLLLLLKRKRHSIKVVSTVASYLYAYNLNLSWFDKLAYKLFLSCSDSVDSLYANIVNIKNKKIYYTPCSFTDYNRFTSSKKENIIVFAGRLIEEKNPSLFLEAINKVVNIKKNSAALSCKFYIIGNGPLKSMLQKYVFNNNLSNYVVFCEGDTANVLARSKIFVSLQQYENYPSQSLLEAIACKNLIIATDVGDTKKIVKEKFAKLIEPNVDSLADAMVELLEDEDEQNLKVEKLLNDIKVNHNIDRFINYLLDLWEEVDMQ